MRRDLWLRGLCGLLLGTTLFTTIPVDRGEAARRNASSSSSCLPGVLKRRLSQIRAKFGRVRVISTYRRGARIAGSGRRSFHASCRAVDFHPPRGKYRAVVAWLKRNHFGGVGTYSCGMYHIHIDNGPRVRFHHCVNRRGRPSRYAKRSRSRKYAKRSSRSRRASRRARRATRSPKASIRAVARKAKPKRRQFTHGRFVNRLSQNGS